MSNWEFTTNNEEYTAENLPIEWVWERLRNHRDNLLKESDYRMVPDAPWDTIPWVDYRKDLRNLPKTTKDPRIVEWPVAPND